MDEIFENILGQALQKQATDIHIVLKEQCSISFRIFGELLSFKKLNKDKGCKLINYIRFKAKIDINYRLKPQTGHYNYLHHQNMYYLRISSLPSQEVDSLVIRILNNHKDLTLQQLTVLPKANRFLKSIITRNAGLFVVSGATGSGKSTTLYTLLDSINQHQRRNIVTLEDPIEIKKEYCLQIQINERMGITYENSLRQILRHDSDIIMIGEIRDKQTAKLAITCALTGHLVFTTIHASSCLTTIRRLLNLEILTIDLEDILIGVMTQRMLYQKNNHAPIVLMECMEQKEVQEYLQKGLAEYNTFQENARYLVNNQYVERNLVKEYFNE